MKVLQQKSLRRRRLRRPTLQFTPWAWAKLVYWRDRGPTEIGGFGISDCERPLLITDVVLVPQSCTSITTKFDDVGVADYFDRQVDAGRRPEEFGRLWLHTHPGTSPEPSGTDEETFTRVFGNADWAVMFILARGGAAYARLRFRAGPGGQLRIPVEVDFGCQFAASDHTAWNREYQEQVRMPLPELSSGRLDPLDDLWLDERRWEEFGEREAAERHDPFLLQEVR